MQIQIKIQTECVKTIQNGIEFLCASWLQNPFMTVRVFDATGKVSTKG